MKRISAALVASLLTAGLCQAQDVKCDVLIIAWYTQMMNNNLRWNSAPLASSSTVPHTLSYYSLGGTKGTGSTNPYNENGFSIRRSEFYVTAKITDEISGNLLLDPNQPTPLLLDAFLTWKPSKALEVKMGQFKPIGYEATLVAAADLFFTDRAQVVRYSSDYRDRGVQATYIFGDKAFGGRFGVGLWNGSTDRQNDQDAQKDVTARLDMNVGEVHKFGAYAQQGSTNVKNAGPSAQPGSFGTASATNLPPTTAEIFDNRDKTSTYGAYYAFNQGPWHADVELATGLMGRRNSAYMAKAPDATTGNANPGAGRQHLDQKFLGYELTGAYTTGHHIFRLRYDFMNYNLGDRWYTTYNPYRESAPGVARADGGDYTPKYKEITVGYTYAFNPEMIRKANIKFDYIMRSKNFLAPRLADGQIGEQGGDSAVVAFQVWF